jgi:tetratricopeptide (TPR) repeat protein
MRCKLATIVALALVFAGTSFVGVPADAYAQDDAAKKEAVRLLASGDRKLQRGDRHMERDRLGKGKKEYESALADYQAAYDSYPQPKIFFPIARAEQKLGRFLDAFRHYNQLLEEVENPSDALKTEVKKAIAQCKENLGAFDMDVKPKGATIKIDDNEIGIAPLSEPFYVSVAEHTYVITADGHTPREGKITIQAGEVYDESIVLEKIPLVVGDDDDEQPILTKKKKTAGVNKMPLYIGLGATGGLAALATLTGVLAASKHGTFTDDTKTPAERESAKDSGKKLALTTDILFVATIGAGAFTAYYYYKVFKPEQAELEARKARNAKASIWWSPYASDDGAGVAVGGRF